MNNAVLYLIIKASLSGLIIAAVSGVARRWPGFGALIASLPLVSILGMMWLWKDKPDSANMADHIQATFWYILPSLPMFLVIPWLLRRGVAFYPALAIGCAVTVVLYLLVVALASRLGLKM